MNYHDLTKELSKIRSDIETKMNNKRKETNILIKEQLDREIDFLEYKKLELLSLLKSKNTY